MSNLSNIPRVVLPGSKSITNRAFLLAALSGGESRIYKPLYSDDTRYMMDILKALGYGVIDHGDLVEIGGGARITPGKTFEFFIGNAGTTIRFLTTFLASLEGGVFILKGESRMHERPIRDLVAPLRQAGAQIEYLGVEGFPPLKITGKALNFETVELDGSKSSQYITSVLLCLAALNKRARVRVKDLVSRPYIDTTLAVLRSFGVRMAHRNYEEFWIEGGNYRATDYAVPADASSASYFLGEAFLSGRPLALNLGQDCLQGDFQFVEILRELGGVFEVDAHNTVFLRRRESLSGFRVDMNAIPDTVQTLAVMALFLKGTTTIENVGNLRIKETDRLLALENELAALGAQVATGPDSIRVTPDERGFYHPRAIKTYGDHRMAMSFALAKRRIPGMSILNPEVVSKSFENFWEVWDYVQSRLY